MCPIIHRYVPWVEGHHQGLGYLAVSRLDLRELFLYWCVHGSGASTLPFVFWCFRLNDDSDKKLQVASAEGDNGGVNRNKR